MTQAGGRKQTKLSELQKDIVLWIGYHTGDITRMGHLATGEPPSRQALRLVLEDIQELGERLDEALKTRKAGESLLESLPEPRYRGVPWEAKPFLGRPATPSESSSLNKSLFRLEERGLIKRTRSRGKRKHTSHVNLTSEGLGLLLSLLKEDAKHNGALYETADLSK